MITGGYNIFTNTDGSYVVIIGAMAMNIDPITKEASLSIG